jgi:hypothetical protein
MLSIALKHAFPRSLCLGWLLCTQLLLALFLAAAPARALDWATLAQPVGTFVGNTANPSGVYAPATINTLLLPATAPFDSGTSVTLIRVTQTHQVCRKDRR